MLFFKLLKTDLLSISIKDVLINSLIWCIMSVFVQSYLMQYFGLSQDYGNFLVGSTIVSIFGMNTYSQVVGFLVDIESIKTINYRLLLPMSNTLVLLEKVVIYTIKSILISLPILPVCKLLLWNKFALSEVSFSFFFLSFFISTIFFGCFTLFSVSVTKSVTTFENVIFRMFLPLWMMGGYQFSWKVIYDFSPILGYISLLNPYFYSTEMLRVATIGPSGFLPFWISFFTLSIISLLITWFAVLKIKTRLDYI